jgi:hypothetical protein
MNIIIYLKNKKKFIQKTVIITITNMRSLLTLQLSKIILNKLEEKTIIIILQIIIT